MVGTVRPSKDRWFSDMAMLTSRRSTCHRLEVGCVLVNVRGHVLSTGYNGRAAGLPHCNEEAYRPATEEERNGFKGGPLNTKVFPHRCPNSVAGLGQPNGCESIHAEQNALLQCGDVYAIDTCYVTHSPCLVCVKLLLNTGCQRIVFTDDYPQAGAKELWVNAGHQWIQKG